MEIRDFDKQIAAGALKSLYFLYGEEQFLLEHKINTIKQKLLDGDFADLNFAKLEGKKITAKDIETEIDAVPVMAEKRVVLVKNTGIFGNSTSKEFKALIPLLSDLPDYLVLIFCEVEFDKKKEKNLDVFRGNVIKFDYLSPSRLEAWLEQLFLRSGKTILNREIREIIARCGQSMARLHSESQKLTAFLGDRDKVTPTDVDKVVTKTTESRIFEMIDNLALGKCENVMAEIFVLKNTGENPSTVLSLLSARMGDLLAVKQLNGEKAQIGDYFLPKKPPFVINKLLSQSKGFSEGYLKEMSILGLEYTAKVRSGVLDKWDAVLIYVTRMLQNVT